MKGRQPTRRSFPSSSSACCSRSSSDAESSDKSARSAMKDSARVAIVPNEDGYLVSAEIGLSRRGTVAHNTRLNFYDITPAAVHTRLPGQEASS